MPAISKLAFRGPVLVAPRFLCVIPARKLIPFAIVRHVTSASPAERVDRAAQKAKVKVEQVRAATAAHIYVAQHEYRLEKVVDKVRGIDELIITDHRSIRELYDRYQKEVDEVKKETIVNEFIREVALHSAAEEMILYPVLDSLLASESRIDVGNLRGGHQKVKEGLYQVDEMMSSKGKGAKSVEKALAGVMKHVPTRPHPSAPDTGGFKEFMAGLPAAMIDRVKDMGKEFAERRIH
ncbi:hypothetical protein M427DRAFT_32149 [Gonapodya prolifera JEL478]|uniref:Hemerythrin-like domain-containing protein n=1 Tax=Gonapodya prolifera (strain JEL478) TaxID=1344416 RepID=A0A139AG43_GONPJ|nr:hypothetical protein M427DRAFT_32149 [Gonapodya prolifera JEL478]|eukprot:KXS15728.1 hypothetical protein M427DRAFT_32149 [Gonapodya prolifera JEL478]